jgi:hypothetical protein
MSRLSRRVFLASSAVAVAGCSKKPLPPEPVPEPTFTPEEQARAAKEQGERNGFLKTLEDYRSATGEKRETPKPPVDLAAAIPELKTQLKIGIRMHPRFGEEPPPDASKLGGRFLWPVDAKWPLDAKLKIPMVPVLQLRAEHAPPAGQCPFRAVCDLMQLFWTARDPVDGELTASVVWRRTAEVAGKTAEPPNLALSFPHLVPVPCRLHPEWIGELPDWETLRGTSLRAKLAEWKPPVEAGTLTGSEYYARFLGSAPGTKVGGWPRASLKAPNCLVCKWPMDYLLTIDTQEWTAADAVRWRPQQDGDDAAGRRSANGLRFGEKRAVEVSICHRCDAWPVRALVV